MLTETAFPISERVRAAVQSAARPRHGRVMAPTMVGSDARAPALSQAVVAAALDGDTTAVRELVAALTPVVQTRVARTLLRRRSRGAADARTFMEDLVQDTFVALFHDNGKLLRSWNPERGLRLESFVGLIAEQRVLATLRSRRKNPWTDELAVDDADLELLEPAEQGPEARALSREALRNLLDEVRARLSPMGLELFMSLVVREESIASVCARTRLSTSAVQAWSSRLRRLVHTLAAQQVDEAQGGGSAA